MLARIGICAAIAAAIAIAALWHPSRGNALTGVDPMPDASPLRTSSRAPAGPEHRSLAYVTGAVAHPGLYRVAPAERVADVVKRAGGLDASADPAGVNLAAYVQDGDEIDVPRVGQTVASSPSRRSSRRHRKATRAHGRAHRRVSAAQASVDVNAAGAEALSAVPGIGPSIASRIVELRERSGAYASLDELLDVSGMTASRLEQARPYLQPLP
jgi:competence protein ComEA